MKAGSAIVGALVLGGGAWLAVEMYGDSETKQARDDAADGAEDAVDNVGDHVNPENAIDGANKAADTIAGLSPAAWQVITIGVGVFALLWIWKDPKRRAFALMLALVALLVFIVSLNA